MTKELSKLNFRDIGGIRTANGQFIKKGLIYRTEGPASFTAVHREELAALGVRTVCDLRSDRERATDPNDWCGPDCRLLHLSMNNDLRARDDTMWESFRADPSHSNTHRVMLHAYGEMPAALAAHWPLIMGAILAGEMPLIVHCTAGKDRTGVTVGLLLALLQVAQPEIFADYAKSDVYGQNLRKSGSAEAGFLNTFGFVPPTEVMDLLIGTHPEYLQAALQEVERRWGGVERYFLASGIDAAKQAAVRSALLESR